MRTKELVAALKAAGCYLIEHRKKHDKWINPANGKTTVIGRHNSQEVATGTFYGILKELGLR